MTRDFLKNLGVEDAAIDKILDENMVDIGKEKSKTSTVQTELAAAQEQLKTAQSELEALKKSSGDASAVQKELEELQAKYDTETEQYKAQLAERDYSDAITRAIGSKGLKFSSKSAERAFTTALKEKNLALKDSELEGLDGFIQEQKEADPDAFAPDKAPPRFVTGGGSGHSASGSVKTPAEQMAESIGRARAESSKTAESIISTYTGGKT